MENKTAIALLEIAAQLATTTLAGKTATASTKAGKPPTTEAVFADCLKEVEAHFSRLLGQ